MSGTFAEFFVVRADRARKVGDMPLGLAALAEPVCVCLEALAQARLAAGGRLLIIGDGPFGAMLANLAPEFKPAEVVIAGHHDFRMGFAPPATTKVNLKTAGADALKKLAGPLGFDAAILAVGSAKAVATCIELLRPKGRLVIFSAIPGLSSVDLFRVHVRELELIGACNDQERFDEALSHLRQPAGRDLGRLITHGLPLEQYRQAIELADRGRETAMKVAFELKAGELPR
jgi:threonine dehydrogenase-like Zn-dependent dehydrogenase